VKVRDLRQHPVEGLALGGVVIDGIEVLQATPAAPEDFGGLFKGQEGAVIGCAGQVLRADGLDVLF